MAALTTGRRSLGRWESTSGLLFITPWILGFLIFSLGPMIASLYLSFCKYDLHTLEWVGAENYRRLLTADPLFWRALQNTVIYVALSVLEGVGLWWLRRTANPATVPDFATRSGGHSQ